MAIVTAANAFIDRLPPSDRVAVAGFGLGAPVDGVHRRTGTRQAGDCADDRPEGSVDRRRQHNISLVEAHGDRSTATAATLETVVGRECAGVVRTAELEVCRSEVETDAREKARTAEPGAATRPCRG